MTLSGKICACGLPAELALVVGEDRTEDRLCVRCVSAHNEARVIAFARGCGWCGCTTEPLELVGEVRACRTCVAVRGGVSP